MGRNQHRARIVGVRLPEAVIRHGPALVRLARHPLVAELTAAMAIAVASGGRNRVVDRLHRAQAHGAARRP